MMTLEELTSWRVAAIEGKLPEPVRSGRWQPLRAGVVNLWEYDTAEVWYADGRMQLQGANESGKSTLMTLTTCSSSRARSPATTSTRWARTTSASAITSSPPTTP